MKLRGSPLLEGILAMFLAAAAFVTIKTIYSKIKFNAVCQQVTQCVMICEPGSSVTQNGITIRVELDGGVNINGVQDENLKNKIKEKLQTLGYENLDKINIQA